MKALLSIACALLAGLLYLEIENRQLRQKEDSSRQDLVREISKTASKIEDERTKVLADFIAALNDEQTKSIYHQLYHANSAQLKMQNLAVQEHQLLIQILAAKR